MKKLFIILVSVILCKFILAAQINITNNMSHFGANKLNIILEADKDNVTASDLYWKTAVVNALAKKAYIGNDLLYSLNQVTSGGYPWASVGYKIYLLNSNGNVDYLGYLNFTIHGNSSDAKGIISDVSYSSQGIDPKYSFEKYPTLNYINDANFEILGSIKANSILPPIITNSGWNTGMGNTYGEFVPDASFWVQDYGMNEVGRWTVDSSEQAIQQSIQPISGSNVSSRAYPVMKKPDGSFEPGIGGGLDGVWQIDIKIGSNGGGDFCETFYLAERKNFAPGPENYMDASGRAPGGVGREIDILETKWKPSGPQINLPVGNGSSWNSGVYQNYQMANWSDVGGAPTKQFITFGAYIKDKTLWIYAYKPDGTIWYSTDAIPLHSNYVQEGKFVPYIGTFMWQGSNFENFYTKYKNFIYLPASKIPNGINPKDHPEEFFKAVHAANNN